MQCYISLQDVHSDSISSYGTEKAVGKAIKQSGVPRSEIFVTSKLWNNKHHPDDVGPALQETLNDLGLDYLDLFLMHWPVAFKRGDDMFPTDKDGNMITDNIDYVDVSCALPWSQKEKHRLTTTDLQSYGEAP
jgi:diketogulonate reductase-like aldo/keto reductase